MYYSVPVTFFAMAAGVADAARRARSGEWRGGKVTEHDLRLVLRLAKRADALEVRVGGMTIMFARDAGKRSAQAAPTRRSPAAVPPRAPQSTRPARTARPEEPEAEAPSTSPNSRHRRSAKRLLVFQRLRESCFGAPCPNSTPPAAVDPELDEATCAEEPRQLRDSLVDAVHTTALKRRLSFCLSSICGQDTRHRLGCASTQPRDCAEPPALGLHSAGDVLRETTLLMSPQRRGLRER